MVVFKNKRRVLNQAGHQVIHGNLTIWGGDRENLPRPNYDSQSSEKRLDKSILASLAFPEMLDRKSSIESPHQQTCQWVLSRSEFIDWKAKSSGLLWIKGKPGAGKSTLMAHMYRAVCSDPNCGIRLEFFFSARGVQLQRTPLGMLRSLLCQIFNQDPGTRGDLRKSFLEKCALFGQGDSVKGDQTWQWQRSELESLLLNIILTSARSGQITIFIDALDEAGDQAARQVARYFHDLNDRITEASLAARICISCRHYPILSTIIGTEIYVEQHNRDDIATYIRSYVNPHFSLLKYEWEHLINDLVQQANGIFQWARLVAPMVERFIVDGDSPENVRKWLRQVPEELENVYRYILQNVINQGHAKNSYRLFEWVCLAQRSLSVEEVRYAVATHDIAIAQSSQIRCSETSEFVKDDRTMELRIKSWSGGLVEVISNDRSAAGVVQVIHQSVTDFFLSQGLNSLAEQSAMMLGNNPPQSSTLMTSGTTKHYHHNLYWCCLNYLSNEQEGVCLIDPENKVQKERQAHSIRTRSPFIVYAAMFALAHAEKAGIHRSQDLELEFQLLSSIMNFWMHARRTLISFNGDDGHLTVGSTVLHVAVGANLEDLVMNLLDRGVDIDAGDIYDRSALHVAAYWGRLNLAKKLIDTGADIQKRSTYDYVPLLTAGKRGHDELFSLLVNQAASLDLLVEHSYDALCSAIEQGSTKMITILVEAGGDTRARGMYGSVLELASRRGHEDIVRLLIKADADAELEDQAEEYSRAIYLASTEGHHQVVRLLVEAGGDVNAPGAPLGNALQAAAYEGHAEVVRMLTRAGADPCIQGGLFDNPLHAMLYRQNLYPAIPSGEIETIISLLIEAGASVNIQGGFFGSPLQAASFNGSERAVSMLIDAGADVNALGGRYGCALQAAMTRKKKDVMALLRSRGACTTPESTMQFEFLNHVELDLAEMTR